MLITLQNDTEFNIYGLNNHPDIEAFVSDIPSASNTDEMFEYLESHCKVRVGIKGQYTAYIVGGEIWCTCEHDDDATLLFTASLLLDIMAKKNHEPDISRSYTIDPDQTYDYSECCPHCGHVSQYHTRGKHLCNFHVCHYCNKLIKPCSMCGNHNECCHCPLGKDVDIEVVK